VMVRHVQQVQERLRRPLAVENLSAYVQWAHADWSEPDFLTELARRSGCELLIDVNNLVVNALNAEGAPRLHGAPGHGQCEGDDPNSPAQHALAHRIQTTCAAWMEAIGGDVRIAEIHLAGHTHTDDGVVDDHGHTVSAPVWAVHRHALARWGGDVPTLIEWDTDVPPWPVLLAEVERARACTPTRVPGSV
jgi:uncharacterized protein